MANLSRWNPFGKFRAPMVWDESLDRFMRQALRPMFTGADDLADIALDVVENDGAYRVKAEVPGVKKEDISVSLEGNQVAITVDVKREKEEKQGDKVLCSERYHGRMYRSFSLPTEIDQTKADAKYADGVLELTLPKKAGSATRNLEIH